MDDSSKADMHAWKTDVENAFATKNYDELNALLCTRSQQNCCDVERILKEESWIFNSLCQSGLAKIVEHLLTIFTLDVNAVHNGMTGLQLACQAGHCDVVDVLLNYGAQMRDSVWEEDSEFYLATFHGHLEVVNILLSAKSEIFTNTNRTSLLFYCACKGGHLNLIHKWLTPDIDVNREISYVSSLDECENQYPLFAACKGSHFEIAEFLINDLHARITKDITQFFPDFVCQLVRKMFRESNHCREQTFIMADLEMDHVDFTWFNDSELMSQDKDTRPSSYSNFFETKVDLSKNRISSLPTELIWQLPSLILLNASWNPIKDLPHPVEGISIKKNCLTRLLLSHCQLEKLNIHIFHLPHLEELDASHNHIDILYEEKAATFDWKCHQLKSLNLAHNCLSTLPPAIQGCLSLESLYLNNNSLTRLCSPWQCPLKVLDISYNQLETFPPSCDQFWAESLQFLNASHNLLDHLHESMVKMDCLKNLDISHNTISSLPQGSLWSCPLLHLNLSYNKLGHSNRGQRNSSGKTSPSIIELPPSCLASTLHELFLNNNDLHAVPEDVCHMQALNILDISHNPLKSLPLEIGRLWNLLIFKSEGIKIDDKDLQLKISELNDKSLHTYDFVMYMEQKRRKCMNHDLIKLVVFGCKSSGNHCFVKRLIKQGRSGEKNDYCYEHKTMCVYKWKLPYSRKFKSLCQRDLTFGIWEFPVNKYMSVIHPCFLTQNSLYIIVHDAIYDEDGLEKVSQQIAVIQASVLQPCIIVVCIFSSLKDDHEDKIKQTLHDQITNVFKCHYLPISHNDKSSWDALRGTIHSKACEMKDVMEPKRSVVNRKVPKFFIEIVDKMETIDKLFCSINELLSILGLEKKDLQDTVDRRLRMQEYLLQVGAMLHYNMQMGDLWNLVIVNPVWLYDLLKSFMKFVSNERHKSPQITIEEVRKFASKEIGLDLFPAFISLLEHFNIGMRLEEGSGKESLLIPSLLPKQPPALLSDDIVCGLSTSRLYCLPAIPNAFWCHVICQLIPAFDRFSRQDLKLMDSLIQTEFSDDVSKSFRRGTRKSMAIKGLSIQNKGIQFWRCGIMVWHDEGLIVVEEVQYMPQPDSHDRIHGVLVTVKTRNDSNDSLEKQNKENLKKLAVIGIVTDELEEILELFNPKFLDYVQECQPFALCPHCHKDIKPGQGIIQQNIDHFPINICATSILWRDVVYCGKHVVFLNQLMPELMFLELPEKLCIPFKELVFTEEKLGQGMAGTVLKGHYGQVNVAIKSFYTPSHEPSFETSEDPMYPNVGSNDNLRWSMTQQDKADEDKQKVISAFVELRREVSVLSKLKHKCIIAFLGVCVKQQLLLVLELAPLGSFRSQLIESKENSGFPVYKPSVSEPVTITNSLFGKDLTYKILLQISSGLLYLHNKSIIFRDLKPDNILVISMNLDAEINVKLSDYGISRFSTAKGLSGLVGTVCYMAPEVLTKQTYTNKVDVYSLGIVMFESLTGVAPVDAFGSHQKPMVSEIAKCCAEPPHVKLYKVKCNFPYLESLMTECWAFGMGDRPTMKRVIKKMSSDQFLLLHDALWPDPSSLELEVTCIYTCESSGRMSLWISESAQEGAVRFFSVYDISSSMYTVQRTQLHGPKVTAMAKVRDKIWLISKGCKQVEEIVRSFQSKFEVRPGMLLDEDPCCLSCHTWSQPEKDHAIVFIGHADGTITTSHVHSAQKKSVTTTTKLTVTTDYPISSIVSVTNDAVIATAGHTIFFLTIKTQISGDGWSDPSISVSWSFSFYKALNIIEHIDSLAVNDCWLWCSFERQNRLVKFNLEERKVHESMILFLDFQRDQVDVIKETSSDGFTTVKTGSEANNPPPPPLRKLTVTIPLGVISLCMASDLLVVGTDCGGLCLLPVLDGTDASLPGPIPVLRHPEKLNEDYVNVEAHSETNASFSVVKIIQAGKKLVSLIKSDAIFQRMRPISRSNRLKSKRLGNVYESFNDSSVASEENDGVNCLSDTPEISVTEEEKVNIMTMMNARIAIWDDVSDRRLNVMKNYRKSFV